MNTVEIKAAELVATASEYGIKVDVQKISETYIVIRYASNNLKTRISQTAAGNATVKTWERKNVIPNSLFEPRLSWYKAIADRKAGVAA